MNDTIVALRTIAFRSCSFMPLVMVKKTGIVPSGLVNVKNEVKLKREKTPERLLVLPERLIDYAK